MKTKEIEQLGFKNVSLHKGIFTVKKSYFYTNEMTTEGIFAEIQKKIPTAKLVDSGNHWHAFVGGAKSGSTQDSYMWVKFTA